MMKLKAELPGKAFVISQVLILTFGLGLIFGVYHILNLQYQGPKGYILTGPVTNAPASLTLELQSPDDDSLVFSSSTLVTGKTLPNLNILVTSDSQSQVYLSKANGTFSTDFELTPGVNELTIVVFDGNGEEREAKRTVYYSKEKI